MVTPVTYVTFNLTNDRIEVGQVVPHTSLCRTSSFPHHSTPNPWYSYSELRVDVPRTIDGLQLMNPPAGYYVCLGSAVPGKRIVNIPADEWWNYWGVFQVTVAPEPDTEPERPTGLLAAAVGQTRVDLAWSTPADEGAAEEAEEAEREEKIQAEKAALADFHAKMGRRMQHRAYRQMAEVQNTLADFKADVSEVTGEDSPSPELTEQLEALTAAINTLTKTVGATMELID